MVPAGEVNGVSMGRSPYPRPRAIDRSSPFFGRSSTCTHEPAAARLTIQPTWSAIQEPARGCAGFFRRRDGFRLARRRGVSAISSPASRARRVRQNGWVKLLCISKRVIMRAFRNCVVLVLTGVIANVLAEPVSPLPKKMSGHWTTAIPGSRTFTGAMSVVLNLPSGTGPIKGRLTSRGVFCGAIDEPLTGTWDGSELRLESKVRPNVNVQRKNGECGTGKVIYVLTRKAGQTRFDGEVWSDSAPVRGQVTLAP
jgi:hypothetical protein